MNKELKEVILDIFKDYKYDYYYNEHIRQEYISVIGGPSETIIGYEYDFIIEIKDDYIDYIQIKNSFKNGFNNTLLDYIEHYFKSITIYHKDIILMTNNKDLFPIAEKQILDRSIKQKDKQLKRLKV